MLQDKDDLKHKPLLAKWNNANAEPRKSGRQAKNHQKTSQKRPNSSKVDKSIDLTIKKSNINKE